LIPLGLVQQTSLGYIDNNKQTQCSVIFEDMTTSNFDNIKQSKH
jgi:hypothetical protein